MADKYDLMIRALREAAPEDNNAAIDYDAPAPEPRLGLDGEAALARLASAKRRLDDFPSPCASSRTGA